jgi:hypothetical protein
MDFRSPDGIAPEHVNSSTAQGFLIPARQSAVLFAHSDADWEQAAIVHVEGYRLDDELGNYDRLVVLHLPAKDYPQSVMITGWHKPGRPSAQLGWEPSWGTSGSDPSWGLFVAWKDTPAANAPFNDLRIVVVLSPPIDLSGAYRTSVADRVFQVAHTLTYLSTLAEASLELSRRTPSPDQLIGRVIDRYLSEGQGREPFSGSAADLLIWQLVERAHRFQAGSLRDRLLDLAYNVARRIERCHTGP